MPRLVLRPACGVCGQLIRANDWVKTVGLQPVSIAHEIRFARQSIERRELVIGERSSAEAEIVVDVDPSGQKVFGPGGGLIAPPGWPEQFQRALVRAAKALGFAIEDDGAPPVIDLSAADTEKEFRARAEAYLGDAEHALEEARAELELRREEVQLAARRWGGARKG